MTVMPLYGFVQGDTMGIVVLGRLDGTIADLADRLLKAASVRVSGRGRGSYRVLAGDRVLDPAATLRTQAIEPLSRVDLVWDRQG
jgi:hypothetical protein